MSTQKTKGTATPLDVYIGGRIRELRLEKGLSQSALGETVNMSFQQIQKYEKGTNRASGGTLGYLSRALEVGITEFYPPEYARKP